MGVSNAPGAKGYYQSGVRFKPEEGLNLDFLGRWEKEKPPGNDLFSHPVARAVSSALRRFTAVFGMGTGGSASPKTPGDDFTLLTWARQTGDVVGARSRNGIIAPGTWACQSASTGLHGGIPGSGCDGYPGLPGGPPTGRRAVSGSLSTGFDL